MIIQRAKTALSSHKLAILGLVLAVLALPLFCGYIQMAGANGAECNRPLLLATHVSAKNGGLFLSVLFLSFIASALFIRGGFNSRRNLDASLHASLIFLKVAESIPKPYNPILEALRRGIVNPKIYNLAVAAR